MLTAIVLIVAVVHVGSLLIFDYHAAYLAEKFDCIFGPSLRRDPKIMKEFTKKLCPPTDAHGVDTKS